MPNRHPASRTHRRRIGLPKFNTALGKFLALPANLEQKYSDVVAQIYPLKASRVRLQEFCDGYLNLKGDQPNHFEAAIPWVLMEVVDYGKMASSSRNVGWFSQHELAFGVPVRWYKKEDGKWVFVDWAMVFPFIFVDNPLSMSGGREIYGWSKAPIKIDPMPSIFQPGNLRSLVRIGLVTSGTNYGDRSVTEDFLEISQQRPFQSVESAVSDAITAIPRAIASSIRAASSMFETAAGLVTNYPESDVQSLQEILVRLYGSQLNMLAAGLVDGSLRQASVEGSPFDIITLKQVREVGGQGGACFQAIVGSKMGVDRILDGGALFDPILGDTSGGIRISLFDSEIQPIVQTLGLLNSEDSRIDRKPSRLRPLLPFWLKMDLRYGLADYQCWRTEATEWTLGDKVKYGRAKRIPYIPIGSGASQEVAGQCNFPHITLRVMPLPAERGKLQRLISGYLRNDFFEFKVEGQIKDNGHAYSVVCLIGVNFERMAAASSPGIEYSDRETILAAPVLWREKGKPGSERPALIPLYTFAGASWNSVTSYEVYGRLALKANLIDPGNEWLTHPIIRRSGSRVLTVSTELFPKLGASQEAQELLILEVLKGPDARAKVEVSAYLAHLGLSHFWNGNRFDSISLKQILDAKDPVYADYQAIVGLNRRFVIAKRDPIAWGALPPLSVKVIDYPTLPIVETLGLVAQKSSKRGQYPVYELRAIDPFWISGAMKSEPGREMCWRVETKWRRGSLAKHAG